ncbi:hypothetical protein M422DRAFT_785588 [Sphaerobolus stellatus SS14]|uniref:Uncharacterized protein n=1 Tax=Sphaerobolus stellatus (strain SS14) TaxID=990650 RepID=A0A0C9UJ26_SPHS4|nr:hypothetical protein M422DRAFT_785588 [Sphaerobolus stellatus SS14]
MVIQLAIRPEMVPTNVDPDFTKDGTTIRDLLYSPWSSYTNKQSLHATIEEQTKIVSGLEWKIVELKAQVESLEKAKDAANKKIQNARTLLTPIRQIPVEILSEILCLVEAKPGYNNQFFMEDN